MPWSWSILIAHSCCIVNCSCSASSATHPYDFNNHIQRDLYWSFSIGPHSGRRRCRYRKRVPHSFPLNCKGYWSHRSNNPTDGAQAVWRRKRARIWEFRDLMSVWGHKHSIYGSQRAPGKSVTPWACLVITQSDRNQDWAMSSWKRSTFYHQWSV